MNKKRQKVKVLSLCFLVLLFIGGCSTPAEAQEEDNTIEISVDGQKSSVIDEPVYEQLDVEVLNNQTQLNTGYTTTAVNVRVEPNTNCEILETFKVNTEIKYIKENDDWNLILYKDGYAYMSSHYISDNKTIEVTKTDKHSAYDYDPNNCLTRRGGVYMGPLGKETYYNLPMRRCIKIMRDLGYSAEEYPYWVREDGCKMLGNYVMVALDLKKYPKGSIVKTSRGWSICVDTGAFVNNGSGVKVDVCTTW